MLRITRRWTKNLFYYRKTMFILPRSGTISRVDYSGNDFTRSLAKVIVSLLIISRLELNVGRLLNGGSRVDLSGSNINVRIIVIRRLEGLISRLAGELDVLNWISLNWLLGRNWTHSWLV